MSTLRRRRRRKYKRGLSSGTGSFFSRLGGAIADGASSVAAFFGRLLPKRRRGEPIYKSPRLIFCCALAVVAAGIAVPLIVFGGGQKDAAADAEPAAAPKSTPEAIDIYIGDEGLRVEKIQARLMNLLYMDADELTEDEDGEPVEGEDGEAAEGIDEDGDGVIDGEGAEPGEEAGDTEGTEPAEGEAAVGETAGEEEAGEEGIAAETGTPMAAVFTEGMATAVTRFQLLCGLEPTGHVTNEVWSRLFAADAPECALAAGMEGEDIKEYQDRLRNLGYLESEPTGLYGTDTEEAVKLFQERNSLTQTGTVTSETSEMLYSEDVTANFIAYGDKSDAVLSMQEKLISLGYLVGKADGSYGPATLAAVKLFQQKNDLIVDGYLGYQTKTLLMSDDAEHNAFTIGDEGSEVTRLQDKLVKLKYINKATGYFGSDTDTAVRNFQKLNGLSADGKAGPKTLAVLYSDSAVVAKTTVKVGQNSKVNSFITAAKSKMGNRYVGGGKGPNVFDCSGFVYWCLKQAGIKQSYVTSVTWRTVGNYKTIKDIDSLKKGDIICFKPHHVGIILDSNYMIDASSSNGKVVKRSYKTAYWRRNFVCARRVF